MSTPAQASVPSSVHEDAPRASAVVTGIAAAASVLLVVIGVIWLVVPRLNAFGPEFATSNTSLISGLIGPYATAILATMLGVCGLGLVVALRLAPSRPPGWLVSGWAALVACGTALAFGSLGLIAITGYLFGMAMVVAAVFVAALMVRRSSRAGLVLIAVIVVVVGACVLFGVQWTDVATLLWGIGSALWARIGEIGADVAAVAAIAGFAAIAMGAFRSGATGRRFEAWLVRHRRLLTILAAAGPLPYAIVRATWLTPWPLFGPSGAEMAELPEIRVTGLMLGSGAVAASILTLGLILPWGTVFPKWMPGVGGRRVPPAVAIAPGLVAALILCVSAVPMLLTGAPAEGHDLATTLLVAMVLPLWFWGPALALAVWAYAAWRRAEPGYGEGPGDFSRGTPSYGSTRVLLESPLPASRRTGSADPGETSGRTPRSSRRNLRDR